MKALAALLVLAPLSMAWAADIPLAFGDGKPAVSIVIPDDWHPKLGRRGVEGMSPDGQSFLVAKVIKGDEKAAGDYDAETAGYLEEQGVAFAPLRPGAEAKTTDSDIKINDLDAFVSRVDDPTTFKGAPTTVTYYAIPVGDAETLNIVTRGRRDDPALAAVVATVKPLP